MHHCSALKKPNAQKSQPKLPSDEKPQSDSRNKKEPWKLTIRLAFLGDNKKHDSETKRAPLQEPQPLMKETPQPRMYLTSNTKRDQERPEHVQAKTLRPSSLAEEIPGNTAASQAILANARKKFFAGTFTLVIVEEILRLASYVMKPSLFTYLDGNIYVRNLYQSVSPYIASLIVFALVCLLLFVTAKLATRNQAASNSYTSLLKEAIPIGIFTVTSAIYVFSITNWLLILTS
jgi:hypothetical protein